MSPTSEPPPLNEAGRLAQDLIDLGYNRSQVAGMIGRNASIITQIFTKGGGKGKAYIGALQEVLRAVRGGERDLEFLTEIAQQHITDRRTRTGQKARVRGKNIIGTLGRSSTGTAGHQAIQSGASHLADVVHETAKAHGRIAITVRMKADQFTMAAGSREDSPGLRRGVVPRSDGTEERKYGSQTVGRRGERIIGFDASEWSRRVAQHRGDVTAAVKAWLVETDRAVEDADIRWLQIRGWVPNPPTTRGRRR
ncbi:helix-turn-helix domain containing protein [Kitasatospora sp. NPDC127060]|uniref:helix-turn-helix domain containing protein n=1 Tax=Kitasatospora sp. NPDC127060 TaxID=3347121 RepID=UPI00365BB71B